MMRNYLRKGLRKVLQFKTLALRKWYVFQAKIQCFTSDGMLVLNDGLVFNAPVRCDGKGKVVLRDHVTLGYKKAPRWGTGEILIQARYQESAVSMGRGTVTSNNVSIVATQSITIGEDCIIGDNVFIVDSDFHNVEPELRQQPVQSSEPVVIGDNVWLGSRAMILKGVTIGNNSVVAAGAIVVKPVPDNTVVAGVPAKAVKKI